MSAQALTDTLVALSRNTVAAMAGAVVGASCGLSALPSDAVQLVREVNDLHLEPLVDGLLALRSGASRG